MAEIEKRNDNQSEQIQVYVSLKPCVNKQFEHPPVLETVNFQDIVLKQAPNKKLSFNSVFPINSPPMEIFNKAVKPVISKLLSGYNCTILDCAIDEIDKVSPKSGSLPCLNMIGDQNNQFPTIIQQAIEELFDEIRLIERDVIVRFSYLELFNGELHDLLNDSLGGATKKIKIYEDRQQKQSVKVEGAKELIISDRYNGLDVFQKAHKRFHTLTVHTPNKINQSHLIFSINVCFKDPASRQDDLYISSTLKLVYLAGSNNSLLDIGRVIEALLEKSPHVPYRASKLTRILQDSFGGQTSTTIIARVTPSRSLSSKAQGTLELFSRARNIINKLEVNKVPFSKLTKIHIVEEKKKLLKNFIKSSAEVQLSEEEYTMLINRQKEFNKDIAAKINEIRIAENCLQTKNEKLHNLKHQYTDLEEQYDKIKGEIEIKSNEEAELIREKDNYNHTVNEYEKITSECHDNLKILVHLSKNLVSDENLLTSKIEKHYHIAAKNIDIFNRIIQKASTDSHLLSEKVKEIDKFYNNHKTSLCGSFDKRQQIRNELTEVFGKHLKDIEDKFGVTAEALKKQLYQKKISQKEFEAQIETHLQTYINTRNDLIKRSISFDERISKEFVAVNKGLDQILINSMNNKILTLQQNSLLSKQKIIKTVTEAKGNLLKQIEEIQKIVNFQKNELTDCRNNLEEWYKNAIETINSLYKGTREDLELLTRKSQDINASLQNTKVEIDTVDNLQYLDEIDDIIKPIDESYNKKLHQKQLTEIFDLLNSKLDEPKSRYREQTDNIVELLKAEHESNSFQSMESVQSLYKNLLEMCNDVKSAVESDNKTTLVLHEKDKIQDENSREVLMDLLGGMETYTKSVQEAVENRNNILLIHNNVEEVKPTNNTPQRTQINNSIDPKDLTPRDVKLKNLYERNLIKKLENHFD